MLKLLWMLIGCLMLVGSASAVTPISDIIYLGDGTRAAGRVVISWRSFTTEAGVLVAAGSTSVTVTNGVFSASLQPTVGASPPGTTYTVRYNLQRTSTPLEYWAVPDSVAAVTISSVRTSEPVGFSVALSRLARENAAIGQFLTWNGSQYAPSAAGTITGVTGTSPIVATGTTSIVISCPTCIVSGRFPLPNSDLQNSTFTIGTNTTIDGTTFTLGQTSYIGVKDNSSVQKVRVSQSGTLANARREINLIPGDNVTLSTVDDLVNDRINVTINAGSSNAITTLNTLTAAQQTLSATVGSGDLTTIPTWVTAGGIAHILKFFYASTTGVDAGLVSNTEYLGLEKISNKGTTYAGLSGGKLTASVGTELWALADLSDVSAKVGTGTKAVMAGASFVPTVGNCVQWTADGAGDAGSPCGTGTGGGGGGYGVYSTSKTGTTWSVAGTAHGLGTCDLNLQFYTTSGTQRLLVEPNYAICETAAGATQYDITVNWVTAETGRIVVSHGGSTEGGSVFSKGTATYNAPSLAPGECTALQSITVSGATVGAYVVPSWPYDLPAGMIGSMMVSASDVVSFGLCNHTGSVVDLSSRTYGAAVTP